MLSTLTSLSRVASVLALQLAGTGGYEALLGRFATGCASRFW